MSFMIVQIRGYKTKGKRPDPTDEYNGKMPKEHVDLEATGYFKITQTGS